MARRARDLATELFNRLHAKSPQHAERWKALFMNQHPGWTQGPLPNTTQQIHDINEFWRVQLGMLDRNTLHARSCIVDNLDPDMWLHNFEEYVMQSVLIQTLPNQRWNVHCA